MIIMRDLHLQHCFQVGAGFLTLRRQPRHKKGGEDALSVTLCVPACSKTVLLFLKGIITYDQIDGRLRRARG